jgi:hypothetical protein
VALVEEQPTEEKLEWHEKLDRDFLTRYVLAGDDLHNPV